MAALARIASSHSRLPGRVGVGVRVGVRGRGRVRGRGKG